MKMKQLAYAISVIGLFGMSVAHADDQDKPKSTEKIEITGSSIKRIAKEGSLPVVTLTQEDIRRSGATSATDLIQALPSMQGFTTSSQSVDGNGGGQTSAALHSLAQKYTLVLLDGHRFAPFSEDGSVNLESIPLDAIERVEVLTDGASALYGSDAVAGVVNFITKKNKTDGNVYGNYSSPQHPGGKSWNAGVSKGWGNLDSDGYNILVTLSHDEQKKLLASQRSFSAQGAFRPFQYNGKTLWWDEATNNAEPANIGINFDDGTNTEINPHYMATGSCGNANANYLAGSGCLFNYAATVQDIPSSKRTSGTVSAHFRVNDNLTLFAQVLLSNFNMKAQFAPPAQPMGLSPTQLPSLWNKYVVPYLQQTNEMASNGATLNERVVGAGGRTDDFGTNAHHFVFGGDGSLAGWDYGFSVLHSDNRQTDTAAGGYVDFNAFSALVASGAYDPVNPTAAGISALQPAILSNQLSTTTSTIQQFSLHAQHDLFNMDGGASIISLGADYNTNHYEFAPGDLLRYANGTVTAPNSTDYAIGGNYAQVAVDAKRTNYGLYAEWVLPATQSLEFTLSGRYDSYSKVHNDDIFDANGNRLPGADEGRTFSAATYKASFRYTPIENLMFRGAYGTGFRAPNMTDIANPLTYNGNTSGTYSCPFPGSPGCQPGTNGAQYDLLKVGNVAGLDPEKSKQWTLGFRYDPIKGFSIGADLWNVLLTDQILENGIPEQLAFNNPTVFGNLFVNPYQDPAGYPTIALKQVPRNLNSAQSTYRGIDWDVSYRTRTSVGGVAAQWTGTQMLKQQYVIPELGVSSSDLGAFGPDQTVIFRTMSNFAISLSRGAWLHTFTAHYKSGYTDIPQTPTGGAINVMAADGSLSTYGGTVQLHVPSYATFDWQTQWDVSKQFKLTGGIKNIMDHNPPFTLQDGGGGDMRGYDGRYADPLGRTFYLVGNYKF